MLPKGKSPEADMKSTLHQFRKVYFNFCNGSCCNFGKWYRATFVLEPPLLPVLVVKIWIKMLPKGKLPDDNLNSILCQLRKVYFNFCNRSWWNLANDAEQHHATFFTCFRLWTVCIKVLPKGKLLEDDSKSTLHQLRKVFFYFLKILNKGGIRG